jgi:hypothetical protein
MNDRPWMAALEYQFAAMRWLCDHGERDAAAHLYSLKRAETYSWSEEISTTVTFVSRSLSPDSRPDASMLPQQRFGWWWLDWGGREHVPFNAILWALSEDDAPDRQGLVVTLFGFDCDDVEGIGNMPRFKPGRDSTADLLRDSLTANVLRPAPLLTFAWPMSHSIRDVLEASEQHQRSKPLIGRRDADYDVGANRTSLIATELAMRFLLAGFVWIRDRVVTMASGHIERHRRKQLGRDHDAPVPSEVKVIRLRRLESRPRPIEASGKFVDWAWQWTVSGHFRNQPYKHGRRTIFIKPHIKGPADKPLKIPTSTVYAVDR